MKRYDVFTLGDDRKRVGYVRQVPTFGYWVAIDVYGYQHGIGESATHAATGLPGCGWYRFELREAEEAKA